MGRTLLFLWVNSIYSYFCCGGKALLIKYVVGVLIGDIKILHLISLFSGVVPFQKPFTITYLQWRDVPLISLKRGEDLEVLTPFFDVVFKKLY